jgi:hypothetical protein
MHDASIRLCTGFKHPLVQRASSFHRCPKCNGYLGIMVPEGNARLLPVSGDQWAVLEMWLSACVGAGSRQVETLPTRSSPWPRMIDTSLIEAVNLGTQYGSLYSCLTFRGQIK